MTSRQKTGSSSWSDSGFTLIELLVVITLTAIILTFAAFEIRHFWFTQAFAGAGNEVTTQLRQAQEQVVAETHPNVFGALFLNNDDEWHLIRYNPTSTPRCRISRSIAWPSGVRTRSGSNTEFAESPTVTATCRSLLGAGTNDDMVFFFGRGTATAGQVTLRSTLVDDPDIVLCVSGVTGRVYREDGDNPCP